MYVCVWAGICLTSSEGLMAGKSMCKKETKGFIYKPVLKGTNRKS